MLNTRYDGVNLEMRVYRGTYPDLAPRPDPGPGTRHRGPRTQKAARSLQVALSYTAQVDRASLLLHPLRVKRGPAVLAALADRQ